MTSRPPTPPSSTRTPVSRHASYSTIDLSFLGLDKDKDVESLGQKILTLAAPYVPLDGVNDAGVACGIFMSYQGEGKGTPTDTQTDKPDLTSTTLLRLILDYADSVEDAVALAEQYDLHDSASSCFHYMVADSTGRSAVLEWVGADADHDADGSQRQLNVLWNDTDALSDSSDWQVVTNFIKTPGYYDGTTVEMKGLDRYEHLAAACARPMASWLTRALPWTCWLRWDAAPGTTTTPTPTPSTAWSTI